jgi:hypothetical protein
MSFGAGSKNEIFPPTGKYIINDPLVINRNQEFIFVNNFEESLYRNSKPELCQGPTSPSAGPRPLMWATSGM